MTQLADSDAGMAVDSSAMQLPRVDRHAGKASARRFSDRQTTIASAVEEQTATTNEMARNVTEAAAGATEIARNVTGVAQAAQETTSGANNTSEAAGELSRMSSELQELVGRFRY